MQRAIITGAGGLLGRHLTSHLTHQGWVVTALMRPGTDPAALEKLGANSLACDLSTDEPPTEAVRAANVVFHTAAAVSDWAPWSYFEANTVRATQNICAAAAGARCPRFVHISTVGVYGVPPRNGTSAEDSPLRSHGRWDYYRRSKIMAEQIVWSFHQNKQLAATVIRPAMMYGPGDRALLGRILPLLRAGKIVFVGEPTTCLPLVHVRDVASAAVLAATNSEGSGQAFNVVNPERVTQKEFLDTIASLIGATPVSKRVPYRLAYAAGFVSEVVAHLLRASSAPRLTRYRVMLIGHPRCYSTDRIRARLGWRALVNFNDGIREAVQWHLDNGL